MQETLLSVGGETIMTWAPSMEATIFVLASVFVAGLFYLLLLGAIWRFPRVTRLALACLEFQCRVLGHRWSENAGPATVAMELDPDGDPENFTTIAEVKGFRWCKRCRTHALEIGADRE